MRQKRLFHPCAALASGDETGFAESDRRFHTVLVESARNPILVELYASLRDRQLRMNLGSLLGRGPARAAAILAEHEAILDALGPDDVEEARARLTEHLSSTRGAVLGH